MIVKLLHQKWMAGRRGTDDITSVTKPAVAIYMALGACALWYGKRTIALVGLLGLIDAGYIIETRAGYGSTQMKQATGAPRAPQSAPGGGGRVADDLDIAEYVPAPPAATIQQPQCGAQPLNIATIPSGQ
jgi:hypothetical protein